MTKPSECTNVPRSDQLKVLIAASDYLPNVGGLQSVASSLTRELQRRGHSVLVVTQKYPRWLPARQVIDGMRVTRWHFIAPRVRDLQNGRLDLFLAGLVYLPTTLARLLWLIVSEKSKVVNLHFVGAPTLFVLMARTLLRFRLVVSLHGDDVEGLERGTWFDRWVFRAALRRADAVTACSRYLLNQAQVIEPSIAGKARVIYNGIESPPSPSPLAKGWDEVTVLAVGRMVPKKGFDVLLRAFAAIHDNALRLRLIGDGPERGRLESLGHELGLNGNVEYCGGRDHAAVPYEIANCRLVVIPSRQEPFGLVALEAMAAGKPIIATHVGGLPEVLEGADVMLVEPDNSAELARAITQTLGRIEREPNYGARNREIAARFSTTRMVDQYMAIYADQSQLN